MEVTSGHQTFVDKYPLFAAVNRCSSRKFKSNVFKKLYLLVHLQFLSVETGFCEQMVLLLLKFCGNQFFYGIQESHLF